MDSTSRPPSPDFPPSSQPRPLRQMPQRAPPMQGQAWPRTPSQGPQITPPPPPQVQREEGALPSPPQLGWAKGVDKRLSRHVERADDLASVAIGNERTSRFTTPTPMQAGTAADLDHEAFLRMIAANQLVENNYGTMEATQPTSALQHDPLSDIFDNAHAVDWPTVNEAYGGQQGLLAQLNDTGRPLRKRQRCDTDETQEATQEDPVDTWQPIPPLPVDQAQTHPAGDTPPPYDATANASILPQGYHDPADGTPGGKQSATPLPTEKGKAREDPGARKERPGQVLISVAELDRLRKLALQNEEQREDGGRDEADAAPARTDKHPLPAVQPLRPAQAIAKPIDIRTALRLPLNGDPPRSNSFPLTVDFNDPEQRRMLRELLQSREDTMTRTRGVRNANAMDMDVDPDAAYEGEPDDHNEPMAMGTGTHTRLTHTGEPRAESSTRSQDLPVGPPSLAAEEAQRIWRKEIEDLDLSTPPMGSFGKFPEVHVRSPTDRLRGIPQEALDEFAKLPRGTKMVLEVYGKAYVDRADATKITRDIEHVIRTVTRLDTFGLTPPPPPAPGTPVTEVPSAWLLTGLTPVATRVLANRHGWANRDVAFFAYDQPEPLPTYLFALDGFNQNNADRAAMIVREEFKREPIFNSIQNLVAANPMLKGETRTLAINIVNSIRVVLRHENNDVNAPAIGHIYMDPPTLSTEQWTAWRDDIIAKGFTKAFYANTLHSAALRCHRCHAADHLSDQCQYMHLGDWHGTYTPPAATPTATAVQTPTAQQNPYNEYVTVPTRGGGRGGYRGYSGGPRRGADLRARGGKKFANTLPPRGG
ncbi:hypothetical protein OH77DRAFT_1584742 [Trametes cingulata]|nr:hypothetical protein OH77DRAFT_1584742 [Trametes cingulata]